MRGRPETGTRLGYPDQMNKRTSRAKTPRKKLLWNISPANDGLVFAEPDPAKQISQIWCAIEDSETWEEFRRAMPRKDYSEILRNTFDEDGQPRPKGSDPFDTSVIGSLMEGNWPTWLQQEMYRVLPREIIDEFSTCKDTVHNGPYCHIAREHLDAIKLRLEALGYVVEDGTDMSFF